MEELPDLTPEQLAQAEQLHNAIAPNVALSLHRVFAKDPASLVITLATINATALFMCGGDLSNTRELLKVVHDESMKRLDEIDAKAKVMTDKLRAAKPN